MYTNIGLLISIRMVTNIVLFTPENTCLRNDHSVVLFFVDLLPRGVFYATPINGKRLKIISF